MFENEIPKSRYKDVRQIGKGGGGVVYRAFDTKWLLEVTLKRLDSSNWDEEYFQHRFLREIQTLRRLNHPAIIRLFDYHQANDKRGTWIVYEYYPGESITDRLKKYPEGLPENEALRIFKEILEGMIHVHKKGVIHRDLKSSNIMLFEEDDSVVIIDFGLATLIDERSQTVDAPSGSPHFMPPEQFESLRETDERTDIWALGVLLQQLLTNTYPFGSITDSPGKIYSMVIRENPLIPEAINESLRIFIVSALEKEKDKRIQSVKEFLSLINLYENHPDTIRFFNSRNV